MRRFVHASILFALMTTVASAQAPQQAAPRQVAGPAAQIHTSLPADSATVTHWYKQNVYDPADNKIGEIMDVLVDREGKITALIVGVGGFLGMGEKDVAVPFSSVRTTTKDNNKWYLVMNSTKDALKSAKGFKYDRNATTWIPEDAPRPRERPPRPRRARTANAESPAEAPSERAPLMDALRRSVETEGGGRRRKAARHRAPRKAVNRAQAGGLRRPTPHARGWLLRPSRCRAARNG
jgi:sporulation protein YlmC with PRC-barrel domain